jgi:hypothetical protein
MYRHGRLGETMEELLRELEDRLNKLKGLASPTRMRVFQWAQTAGHERLLRRYLDSFLSVAEFMSESGGPAFDRICKEIELLETDDEVLSFFSVEGTYELIAWESAISRQSSEAQLLACIVNCKSLALFNDWDQQTASIVEVRPGFFDLLKAREGPEYAINWAKQELEITSSLNQEFQISENIKSLLKTWTAPSTLLFLGQLAVTLDEQGHSDEAVMLLEGVLRDFSEDSSVSSHRGFVNRAREQLEAFVPVEPPSDISEEHIAGYPKLRSYWLSQIACGLGHFVDTLATLASKGNCPQRGIDYLCEYLQILQVDGFTLSYVDWIRRHTPALLFRNLMITWRHCVIASKAWEQWMTSVSAFLQGVHNESANQAELSWWRTESAPTVILILEQLTDVIEFEQNSQCALDFLGRVCCVDPTSASTLQPDSWDDLYHSIDCVYRLRLGGMYLKLLWASGKQLAALTAMETALQVDSNIYINSERLRSHLRHFWAGDVPMHRELGALLRLAVLLSVSGRQRHAIRLMFAINPELSESWDVKSYSRLKTWLADFEQGETNEFLTRLGLVLVGFNSFAAEALLTEHLGISPVHFEHRSVTNGSLTEQLHSLDPSSMILGCVGLMMAKLDLALSCHDASRRIDELVTIGMSAIGIGHEWFSDPTELSPPQFWNSKLLLWHIALAEICVPLSRGLILQDKSEQAILLIKAVFRCASNDSVDDVNQIVDTLHAHPIFIQLLTSLLKAVKNNASTFDLDTIVTKLIDDFHWYQPSNTGSGYHSWLAAEAILQHVNSSHPSKSFNVACELVPPFRLYGLRNDVVGVDRIDLIQFTDDFRHSVIEAGHNAIQDQCQNSFSARLQSLCWDVELGQLFLRERFDRYRPSAPSDSKPLPEGLPFVDSVKLVNNRIVAHLLSSDESTIQSPGLPALDDADQQESRVVAGVTPYDFASLLDDQEKFLRVGFTTKGELVWTLFGRSQHGDRLEILAHNPVEVSGTSVNLRNLLGSAVQDHDANIRDSWANFDSDLKQLEDQRSDAECLSRTSRELLLLQINQRYAQLEQTLRSRLDENTSTFLDVAAKALRLESLSQFLDRHDHLVLQVDDVLHSIPMAFINVGGQYLFERVCTIRVCFTLALDQESRLLNSRDFHLEQSQESYSCNNEFSPPRVIGISWFDQEANAGSAQHWGREFHKKMCEVTNRFGNRGLIYRSAGEAPFGSYNAMACDLATGGSVRILAILGHGRTRHAGVQLADGIWTGAELLVENQPPVPTCTCESIEFLIQVSCSIGRVNQSGARDVDGYCVNLLIGRVRSALAGLWDLHSEDAINFATVVAEKYLENRANLDDEKLTNRHATISALRPRARAVADARRQWLMNATGVVPHGLYTAAAFELYGIG